MNHNTDKKMPSAILDATHFARQIASHPDRAKTVFYFTYGSILVLHARSGKMSRPVSVEELENEMVKALDIGRGVAEKYNMPSKDLIPSKKAMSAVVIPPVLDMMKQLDLLDESNVLSEQAIADAVEIIANGLPKFIMQKVGIVSDPSLN